MNVAPREEKHMRSLPRKIAVILYRRLGGLRHLTFSSMNSRAEINASQANNGD
jgi:hypothetical protein